MHDSTTTRPRMRAISPRTWGGPDVLTMIETDRPVPGPGEILVRVRAAGVNPTDWKARASGGLGLWGDPVILGYDVSGVVEATGFGVTLHRPGDEVFGMPRFPHQAGAYAEYITAPARHFARKPENIDHVHAAALPLAALTAWQSLTETARVRAGQRVLVHAAAGGVGHLAVQVAKALGAHVIGTAGAAKHAFLRDLGADETIDYTRVDFSEVVRDVDVVVDLVGGDYGARSLRVLRRGGILVSLVSAKDAPTAEEAGALGVRRGLMLVEPDQAGMKAVAELVRTGKLRAAIDLVLPLEQAARAHEHGETGRTTGKIVLTVS
ncbi:NADPH:quinone reductase [Microtetraspora sp. NBRC 13810]|uniref:NADP-dependent oxidoreductase n=1 Tax=Microtetraspora sp. NBRC 13810 TaxID=3030990 RepID=UPI0024A54262|nr:NADP-dependent oxidoreductase [Microtetraspora sp. NBRC 13810]GLW07063.1 NADPH:quinone reductase [Microtetraspora sp. NBRC 13810]